METMDFNPQTHKCVLVIDKEQPAGIVANIASVLSITLGAKIECLVSYDVTDKQGCVHPGITQFPIPILGASGGEIKTLRERLLAEAGSQVLVVDFSNLAQRSRTYSEYAGLLAEADGSEVSYLGIALCGARKAVNRATGNLGLIR